MVSFDGRVMALRFVDPEVHGRYGTMVYVRCPAEGARPAGQTPAGGQASGDLNRV